MIEAGFEAANTGTSQTSDYCGQAQGHRLSQKWTKPKAHSGVVRGERHIIERSIQKSSDLQQTISIASHLRKGRQANTYNHVPSNLKFRVGYCRIYSRFAQERSRFDRKR